jgi:hypothetical protein
MHPPAFPPSLCSKQGRRRRKTAAGRFCVRRFGWIQVKGLCSRPMTRATLVVFLASMAAASAALADTYVRTEKDGTKTYSDRPLPGGKPVVLESAQTYSAPAVSDPTRPLEVQSLEQAANFQYSSCTLQPANDQTLQNPEFVTISLSTSPPLRSTDSVNISVDGSRQEGGRQSVQITQPDRGSHTANVEVVDTSGRTLCSASTTFHVQRTNLNSPTRAPTPTPRPRPRPAPR